MQNQDKTDIILSLSQVLFYILKTQILFCLKHANIPSIVSENRKAKTFPIPSSSFSFLISIYYDGNLLTISIMSLVSSRQIHKKTRYFHLPNRKAYKVVNIYEIQNKTLDDFGLKIIDQGKRELPKVWSHDSMSITTPKYEIKNHTDKPFYCTHCGSESYIKYGKENKKQVYKCKDCNRKFVDNLYFERLKGDSKIICITLDLYFKGVSLRKISDHLKQFYEFNVSYPTVLRWIRKYIQIMDTYVNQFQPKLGTVWNADEMMVKINGDWYYLWNVMDKFTRFHLASVISKERKIKDARKAFQTAKKKSHNDRPRCIITDGLGSYNKAINKEFHTVKKETIHIKDIGIQGKYCINTKFDNNIIERLHGTVRDRNKTQRGLKSEESIFVKGHQLYYNFIRSHEGLNGYTPAHFANIYLNLGDEKWKNLLMQSLKIKNQRE